jgi:AraC-like DNA-binding protein/mannose-6-phosphate isomerase-like protein (cupin superfamily)
MTPKDTFDERPDRDEQILELKKELEILDNSGFSANPYRLAYLEKIRSLRELAKSLEEKGVSEEEIAKRLYAERRKYAEAYRTSLPPLMRAYTNEQSIRKYGNPIGPSYEQLMKKKRSLRKIIEGSWQPSDHLEEHFTIEQFLAWCRKTIGEIPRDSGPFQMDDPAAPVNCSFFLLDQNEIGWHWHDRIEFLKVREGGAVVQMGGKVLSLAQGEGCFINSGVLHSIRRGGDHCVIGSLILRPSLIGSDDSIYSQKFLRPLLTNIGFQGVALRHERGWQEEVLDFAEKAFDACINGDQDETGTIRHAMTDAVYLLWKNMPEEVHSEKALFYQRHERVKQMIQCIRRRVDQHLTLEEIAGAASVSESEALRCFRSTIGITPIRYLNLYRLERSRDLLRSTDRMISDIAQDCGYTDPSYFIRAFRKEYGMTPARYRQKYPEKTTKQGENGAIRYHDW